MERLGTNGQKTVTVGNGIKTVNNIKNGPKLLKDGEYG